MRAACSTALSAQRSVLETVHKFDDDSGAKLVLIVHFFIIEEPPDHKHHKHHLFQNYPNELKCSWSFHDIESNTQGLLLQVLKAALSDQ